MSDNESGTKRMGDQTRARIDDLKGGWKLPSREDLPSIEDDVETPSPPEPRSPGRKKARTEPPPPPARKKARTEPPPPPARKKARTEPPPPPVPSEAKTELPALKIPLETPPPRADTTDAPAAECVESASAEPLSTASLPAILPRQTGVIGDIRYAFRAIRTQSQSKRQILALRQQLEDEKQARSHKLLQVAEDAVGDQDNDMSMIGRARDDLNGMEEKRSQHVEQSAKAESAAVALENDSKLERQEQETEFERTRAELAEAAASLEPLLKTQSRLRKDIAKARHQSDQVEAKMKSHRAALEGLVSPEERAPIEAQLASVGAESEALAGELPKLADELSVLDSQIVRLETTRGELSDKIDLLSKDGKEAAARLSEKLTAERARKVVEDRAAVEQADKRQGALLELGEALREKAPDLAGSRLLEAKKHEQAIASLQRRETQIQELLDSIELTPVLRGTLWLILLSAGVAATAFVAIVG